MSAPADKRENLLKELESFAFRGIPNTSTPNASIDEEDVIITQSGEEKVCIVCVFVMGKLPFELPIRSPQRYHVVKASHSEGYRKGLC